MDFNLHEKLLSTLTKDKDFNKNSSLFNSKILGPNVDAIITDWATQAPINKSLPLLQPDINLFMEALQKDSRAMSYSDYKKSMALFEIILTSPDNNFDYESNDKPYISEIYIYPEYKNTLNFLRKRGVTIDETENKIDEIANITYQPYVNSNTSINIIGKERIKTFLSLVQRIPDTKNSRTDVSDVGYVTIYYKNKSAQTSQSIFVKINDSDKITKFFEEDKNE